MYIYMYMLLADQSTYDPHRSLGTGCSGEHVLHKQRLQTPPQLIYSILTLPSSPHRICSRKKCLTSCAEDSNRVKWKAEVSVWPTLAWRRKMLFLSFASTGRKLVPAVSAACSGNFLSNCHQHLKFWGDFTHSMCEQIYLGTLISFAFFYFADY